MQVRRCNGFSIQLKTWTKTTFIDVIGTFHISCLIKITFRKFSRFCFTYQTSRLSSFLFVGCRHISEMWIRFFFLYFIQQLSPKHHMNWGGQFQYSYTHIKILPGAWYFRLFLLNRKHKYMEKITHFVHSYGLILWIGIDFMFEHFQ